MGNDLDLLLKIRGDSTEAQTALSDVRGLLQETFESPQAALSALGERIMASLVSPLGLVAAGGALVVGTVVGLGFKLYEMAEAAAKTGAELQDMSETTGIAVRPLSALKAAAEIAGVEFGTLTNAIFMMQRRMAEDSSGAFERGLKKLGLTIQEFRDLKPEDQLLAISQGFRALPEDANKAGVAFDLFGRQGRDMLPLLMKPLDELVLKARELGLTWSEEDARAAEEFEMSSKALDLALGAIEMRIGRALLPALSALMKGILDNKQLMGDLTSAASGLATVLGYVIDWSGRLSAQWLLQRSEGALMAVAFDGIKIAILEMIQTVLISLSKLPGASLVLGTSLGFVTQQIFESKAALEAHRKVAELSTKAAVDVATTTHAVGTALQGLGADLKAATTGGEEHVKVTHEQTVAQRAHQVAVDALAAAHKKLNPEIAGAVQQMLAAGFQATEIIKRLKEEQLITDDDAEAINRLGEAHKAVVEKQKQRAASIAIINAAEVSLTAAQEDGVRILHERGIAEGDIARALDVSEVAVKRTIETLDLYKKATKQLDDQSRKFVEDQIKRMEADSKGVVDNLKIQVDARKEADDLVAKRTLTSFEYQKQQIAAWAKDAKDKVDGTKGNATAAYDEIDRVTKEKLESATKAWLLHGGHTRAELQQLAVEAATRYHEILGDADATTAEITEAWQEMVDANDAATDGLAASFHKTMRGLPALVVQSLTGGGGLSGALKAVGSQIGTDFGTELFGPKGALAGIGAAIPGIGPVIGSLIGPLMSKIAGLFKKPEYKKVMEDVGKTYGASLSEGLAKEIADMEKKLHVSRTIAEQLSLDKIIGEQGGITSANLQKWEQQAMPLFDVVKRGGEAGAAATQTLTTLLGQFADQTEKNGGVWDDTFKAMIARARELGVNLEAVNGLMDAQFSKMAAGTVNVVKGLGSEVDATFKGITENAAHLIDATKGYAELSEQQRADLAAQANATIVGNYQETFDRVTRITLASFNAQIASGKSTREAMETIGPAVDVLIAKATQFGFAGSAAYDELARWRHLTTEFAPLLDEVSGLNEIMLAMANTGTINADVFADLQAQGVEAYHALQDAGFTQVEMEQQMKPLLENIIRLHKERGFAIDDETQKLIDQATADGVLGEQSMSTNDILMSGFAAIIKAVGGELPDAFKKFTDKVHESLTGLPKVAQTAASGIQDAFDELRDPKITVHYTTQHDADGAETSEIPAFPNRPMEMVRRAGLAIVHPGDLVGVPTPTTMQRIQQLGGGGALGGGGGVRDIIVNVAPKLAVFQDYQAMKDLAAQIREEITSSLVTTTPVLPVI